MEMPTIVRQWLEINEQCSIRVQADLGVEGNLCLGLVGKERCLFESILDLT